MSSSSADNTMMDTDNLPNLSLIRFSETSVVTATFLDEEKEEREATSCHYTQCRRVICREW